MRLDATQHLRLEQKLKLAPQMIQSMEILQLSIVALDERIDQELEKNPVLEIRETNADQIEPAQAVDESPTPGEDERDLVVQDDNSNRDDFERLDNIGDQIEIFRDAAGPSFRKSSGSGEEDPKQQALANTAAREVSLTEYLMQQWDLVEADDLVRRCGELIINHIEADGYFRTDFSELDAEFEQPVCPETWELAITLVQQLDPPGIGARSVQECLLLQLNAFPDDQPYVRQIIAQYWDELQHQKYTRIADRCRKSLDQTRQAVDFIRTRLVLYPGLGIGGRDVPYIVCDVIVEEDDGEYHVIIPRESSPRLHISGYYRKMLQKSEVDKKTRHYLRNHMDSARWLIDAIEQRQNTLRRVTEAIVEAQREFLENGPKHLKPLPMSDVADKIGVHVATVSRAVSGKYVETPRGVFPLRMFFSGGTETENGKSLSWGAVKAKIQEIVDAEDKCNPLKDDTIVEMLLQDGIVLARRTVAKYRKAMNIPSTHRRRER